MAREGAKCVVLFVLSVLTKPLEGFAGLAWFIHVMVEQLKS